VQRRSFLASVGASTAAVGGIGATATETRAQSLVSRLVFESTSSLLDANGGELTDDSLITVYAEPTASNEDGDTAGDAVVYSDGTPIPLAAVDGRVAGFGSQLVTDGTNFRAGNEEFLLNVWDDLIGGGTVLYDESHDSYNSLNDFGNLANYAATQGSYTVTATQDLTADLSGADAVMITSPSAAFTGSELSALSSFVSDGGAVLLHDTADYQNVDETANLNSVAAELGAGFRFNDDQVIDFDDNDGTFFAPTTAEFNWSFPYFADRPGMGIDPTTDHTVEIVEVLDGDTPVARFDSGREISVRLVGIDTPEKASNSQVETVAEWEGIESASYLETWGSNATQFGRDELSGETVTLEFDDTQGIFDVFDRLLGYVRYDATGDGTRDARYNLRAVQQGYARAYDSGHSRHAEFVDAERTARTDGVGLWAESDPENTTADRNRDVDDVYLPTPEAIRTDTGRLDRSRAPVVTEAEATQSGGFASYSSDVPVVGVDESSRVGAIGSPLIDYDYEAAEGYAVDTASYENFVLLTNLIDHLSDTTGRVTMDCGHGQLAASGSLDPEDTAYYQRFLEGVGVEFESVAELTSSRLSDARALLVGAPPESFSASELDALQTFRDDGGAVILIGSSEAGDDGRDNLGLLSYVLGSDLRFGGGSVTDATNNLNGDQTVPTTTNFDTSYPLFAAVDGGGGGDTGGSVVVQSVNADARGSDYDNLNDEYVVFENPESNGVDLTGYAVEDEAGNRYEFPDGVTLAGGATVTLHTGSGTDTDTDRYWGSGSPVWNNAGDTVFVFDDTGSQVSSYSY